MALRKRARQGRGHSMAVRTFERVSNPSLRGERGLAWRGGAWIGLARRGKEKPGGVIHRALFSSQSLPVRSAVPTLIPPANDGSSTFR